MRLVHRRPEAGPARAAFEFGLVLEERQAAKAAGIGAGLLVAEQSAAERGLGAVAQQDLGLFAAEVGFKGRALAAGRRAQVET